MPAVTAAAEVAGEADTAVVAGHTQAGSMHHIAAAVVAAVACAHYTAAGYIAAAAEGAAGDSTGLREAGTDVHLGPVGYTHAEGLVGQPAHMQHHHGPYFEAQLGSS